MATQTTLQLVNCTASALSRTAQHSYQMDTWTFGDTPNLNYTLNPVEFYSGSHDQDDGGEATFSSNGTDLFTLLAHTNDSSVHSLQVQVTTSINNFVLAIAPASGVVGTQNPTSVQWIPLHSSPNPVMIGTLQSNGGMMGLGLVDLNTIFGDPDTATIYFQAISTNSLSYQQEQILLETVNNNFAPVVTDGATWMAQLFSTIGGQQLSNICLPGTHDSGMSQVSNASVGAYAGNTQTQTLTIEQQLLQGIRYIDCRPTIWKGELYFGHFSYTNTLDLGWLGATGQSWDEIVKDITNFFSVPGRNQELLVLDFCNGLNYDNPYGKDSYGLSPADSDIWLNSINNNLGSLLYKRTGNTNPCTEILSNILTNNVQIIAHFDNTFNSTLLTPENGFWTDNQWKFGGSYKDTNDLQTMVDDQKQKMLNYVHSNEDPGLLITSWTLTQDTKQAIFCNPTIEQLSEAPNNTLLQYMEGWIAINQINNRIYPNMIITNYANENVTQILNLTTQINLLINSPAVLEVS